MPQMPTVASSSMLLAQLPYNVLKRTVLPVPQNVESALAMTVAGVAQEMTSSVARQLVAETSQKVGSFVRAGINRIPFYRKQVTKTTKVNAPRVEDIISRSEGESFHFAVVKSALKLMTKIWLNFLLEIIVQILKTLN